MFPTQWSDMEEQGVGYVDATVTQMTGGPVEIDGVLQDDGRDDQVEAGGAVPLVLEDAVAQLAESVEEDGAGERVVGLALVKVGVGALAQVGIVKLVEHEQGAFDLSDLTQGAGGGVRQGGPLCTKPLRWALPLPRLRAYRTGLQHRRMQHPTADPQPKERAIRRFRRWRRQLDGHRLAHRNRQIKPRRPTCLAHRDPDASRQRPPYQCHRRPYVMGLRRPHGEVTALTID